MHDRAPPLDSPLDQQHRRATGGVVGGTPNVGTDNDIGRTCLILDREKEYPLGGGRPLPHKRDAGHPYATALRQVGGRGDLENVSCR